MLRVDHPPKPELRAKGRRIPTSRHKALCVVCAAVCALATMPFHHPFPGVQRALEVSTFCAAAASPTPQPRRTFVLSREDASTGWGFGLLQPHLNFAFPWCLCACGTSAKKSARLGTAPPSRCWLVPPLLVGLLLARHVASSHYAWVFLQGKGSSIDPSDALVC